MCDFTIIGDPHLKHSNIHIMKLLCESVEKLGKPTIWLGDMLDTKEVIRGKCLNFWWKYFSSSNLHHTILVGNHDWFNLECEDHSLKVLDKLKNVTIVDKPMHTPGGIAFIPYIHDIVELKRVLDMVSDSKILFSHLEIQQFDFGTGRICDKGITLQDLKKFKRVISGHFHKYQNKDNLTYLGTPFSHSQGEANQIKYLGLYAVATDTLTLQETNLPKHLTIEFDCDLLNETCDHVILPIESDYEIHHYRIILTGTQDNIDRFPKYMYLEKGLLDIRFLERPTDTEMSDVLIQETLSNEKQFSTWATDIQKLDKETVDLGLQILGDLNGK